MQGVVSSGVKILPVNVLFSVNFQENPQPSSTARPTHIGIDDFALKKGHKYMSVVVNHLTGKLVVVLPSREGKELDEYLLSHPQIQYVTRD